MTGREKKQQLIDILHTATFTDTNSSNIIEILVIMKLYKFMYFEKPSISGKLKAKLYCGHVTNNVGVHLLDKTA